MEPIKSPVTYGELVRHALPGKTCRPSYYSGRYPLGGGDLNTQHFEALFAGLAALVSNEAADRFVRLVNKLEDLTASNFFIELENFVERGFRLPDVVKTAHISEHLRETEDKPRLNEAMGVVFACLGGRLDPAIIRRQSLELKLQFITFHRNSIPEDERRDPSKMSREIWFGGRRLGGRISCGG